MNRFIKVTPYNHQSKSQLIPVDKIVGVYLDNNSDTRSVVLWHVFENKPRQITVCENIDQIQELLNKD